MTRTCIEVCLKITTGNDVEGLRYLKPGSTETVVLDAAIPGCRTDRVQRLRREGL